MPASAHTYETIADKLLEAIAALVEGRIASYSFEGRTFNYHTLRELEQLEQRYRSKASARRHGNVTHADLS